MGLVKFKQRPSRLWAFSVWFLAAWFFAALAWAYFQGYRMNTTVSMPQGLYQVSPLPTVIHKGWIVTLCPLNTPVFQQAYTRHYFGTGTCPGHYQTLLKPVAATEGDWVTVRPQGIQVNHRWLKNSALFKQDGQGRTMNGMPLGHYQVKPGEVWLISTHHPLSFDSRYFGPVPIRQIQGLARPVWIRQ